ncbi:MAG: TIGR04438 family Trp-rich protein [Burkholderiaceae bacterium]
MFLVWLGVALLAAKILEISPVAQLSWLWVLTPLLLAFLWFEAIESALGLDKRKKEKEAKTDEAKRLRIQKAFAEPQRPKR